MKFSVVVPAYNSSATVCRALNSCLAQTVLPLEVLVVDDAGVEVLAPLLADYHERFAAAGVGFRVERLPSNQGAGSARNTGWDMASGDYIAFLDADDWWHPRKLEMCSTFLAGSNCGLLFHGYTYQLDELDRYVSDFSCQKFSHARYLLKNFSATPCCVVPRKLAERFDPSMRYTEDHDLWLRISRKHAVLRLSGPALTFVGREILSAGGLSSNKWKMRRGEFKMYAKYCRGIWAPLLPFLILFSCAKHVYSVVRSVND